MITFGDARTAQSLVERYDHVALYSSDCEFPCPSDIAASWTSSDRRWITFTGDPAASIIDFEQYTRAYTNPQALRNWVQARANDASTRHAWIYTDLSNAALAAHWARGLPFRWWLATLDNVKRAPAQLADLMLAWDVPAEYASASLIDANQWSTATPGTALTGLTDQSICFVNRNW
jgi:hypothetical protein